MFLITNYLQNSLDQGFTPEQALSKLFNETAIKAKIYEEEGLVILDYDQINSPKTHPLVLECRGLVLTYPDFDVAGASFDRFFNLGEISDQSVPQINLSGDLYVTPKLDGSLIKIFYHNGYWHISTRGTLGESNNYTSRTFKELVLDTFCMTDGDFQKACDKSFNTFRTYIFEFTSPFNRIVTPYSESRMTLIGVRSNLTGIECFNLSESFKEGFLNFNVVDVFLLEGSTVQSIRDMAEALEGLEEGFVIRDGNGVRVKVKSSAYLHAHRIRGNGLPTPKNIIEMILTNEYEEYLSVFSEDRPLFTPYINAFNKALEDTQNVYTITKGITDKKQLALTINNFYWKHVVFAMHKEENTGKSVLHVLTGMLKSQQFKSLEAAYRQHT